MPAGRRPRQLNPAFASAHGLSPGGGRRPARRGNAAATTAATTATADTNQNQGGKVGAALRTARSAGRLDLSSCSLPSLPDAAFDLRSGIEIDLSMDSRANPGAWQSRGEEEVASLDLSDNPLEGAGRRLDGRLAKFVSLKVLRAKRSNVAELPWRGGILKLDRLTTLDVSGNDLTGAMLECLPTTVREVDLSSNQLVRLTEEADFEPRIVLPHLIRLDVSDNKLMKLPASMEVPSLQTLFFGKNQIEEVSRDLISQCSKSLLTLEGPNNRLRAAPDFAGCARLTTVDLGDNSLGEIPAISPSVVRLNLINNSLTSIGHLFGGAQAGSETFRSELTELRLRGNRLRDLDEDIVRCLTSLTLLDAGQNDLKDAPRALGYLPRLRRAPLDGNPIRAIRSSLLTDTAALKGFLRKRGPPPPGPGYLAGPDPSSGGGDAARAPRPSNSHARSIVSSALVGTFTLDLSGKRLDALPAEIESELLSGKTGDGGTVGGRIKKLNISKNLMNGLEDWLSAMPGLTVVDASQNRIDSLPNCVGDVPLAELRMARNSVTSAALASSPVCRVGTEPSPLTKSLAFIDLSGNRLEWLPSGLARLPILSTLILANNNIATLTVGTEGGAETGWREGFHALETLNLSDNKIANLADMPCRLVECCPRLRALSLANNELSTIPPEFGVLQSLTSVDLRGNPQRGVRPAVLDRSAGDVLAYLRGRMDGGELRALEARRAGSAPLGKDQSSGDGNDATEGNEKIEELRKMIQDVTLELNNVHLTEAKKYAMKKTLARHKAALIKEERRSRGR